jgi:hypothetical protein
MPKWKPKGLASLMASVFRERVESSLTDWT